MKNPFAPDDSDFSLPRNATDQSFQNVFTTEFGRITPILCQEVMPGDSFKISSSTAIQAMPTVFPVQTKVRVSVSYFYGRNRTVMDNFEDFIFRTKEDITQPWLKLNVERAKKMISTGSLGDFLGVPTTVGSVGKFQSSLIPHFSAYGYDNGSLLTETGWVYINLLVNNINSQSPSHINFPIYGVSSLISTPTSHFRYVFYRPIDSVINTLNFVLPYTGTTPTQSANNQPLALIAIDPSSIPDVSDTSRFSNFNYSAFAATLLRLTYDSGNLVSSVSPDFISKVNDYIKSYGSVVLAFVISNRNSQQQFYPAIQFGNTTIFFDSTGSNYVSYVNIPFDTTLSQVLDATSDSQISNNPFVGDNPLIRLNALPFRHYEQIMNYYFRNDLNNPYILNGEPQYNEFIPTHASGADTNLYDFHYHNWELDKFTSAQQSPQFGVAPLVGLTYSGPDTAELVFQDTDGRNYGVTVGLEDDRIVNIANFDDKIPSANLRKLMDAVNYGISINDFRMVNSFQRFKENMVRRGLRFRNQLKSHFGVNVDYPDIDVPQYIGGYSGILDVSKITNTADSPNAGLGDFVGNLSGLISGKNDIYCYCPEHGYIIGVMSIVPVPVYSQSIKKYLIKSDPFDYFVPEFGKIGYVPIHYSEVSPLQTASGEDVNDVFGYQKAWYDYLSAIDEVHGDFRTNLKDFVLQRLWATRPELVEDFVRVHPEDLNNIFAANNIADAYKSTDKFMCNVQHAIVAKRPIPVHGTPSLE